MNSNRKSYTSVNCFVDDEFRIIHIVQYQSEDALRNLFFPSVPIFGHRDTKTVTCKLAPMNGDAKLNKTGKKLLDWILVYPHRFLGKNLYEEI